MRKNTFVLTLGLTILFIMSVGSGMAFAENDLTRIDMADYAVANTETDLQNDVELENVNAALILDNFNRADGPIGSKWTNQNGSFNIVSNAAQVGANGISALATYNGVTSSIVEGDIQVNGTATQYVGLVLNYANINNNIFLKVQQQNNSGTFHMAGCYVGNNGSASSFGLGFFALDTPFASAHMKISISGNAVTMVFSNIDGGSSVQTYVCAGAPDTGGKGIGIAGFTNITRIDNFSADAFTTLSVTANATGNGTGSIASNPAGISYTFPSANTGTASFDAGATAIVLTAAAHTGSTATWTRCSEAGGTEAGNGTRTATCIFSSLNEVKTVTAAFTQYYKITAKAKGNGEGMVVSAPPDISFTYPAKQVDSGTFKKSSTVKISAKSKAGSKASWNGTCKKAGGKETGNNKRNAVCLIKAKKAATVTATFTK
jgi:hypothetical protein